jgi:NhaP-type Na+/H+ or K+/H+ antiporter
MRPFELAVASALAVGPALGLPLHGGPIHATTLQVLVDSALGLVVGVVLVVVYLAVLRRLDGGEREESDRSADGPSAGRRSDDS